MYNYSSFPYARLFIITEITANANDRLYANDRHLVNAINNTLLLAPLMTKEVISLRQPMCTLATRHVANLAQIKTNY